MNHTNKSQKQKLKHTRCSPKFINLLSMKEHNNKLEIITYSLSDIQDYVRYIIKNMKHYQLTFFCTNTINNRFIFKIKDSCKLELQTNEAMVSKKNNRLNKE